MAEPSWKASGRRYGLDSRLSDLDSLGVQVALVEAVLDRWAPWKLVQLGSRTLEHVEVRPPFRSDSLLSLVAGDRDPLIHATGSAERYGVRFRPYRLT